MKAFLSSGSWKAKLSRNRSGETAPVAAVPTSFPLDAS